jgi:hypothetical protein
MDLLTGKGTNNYKCCVMRNTHPLSQIAKEQNTQSNDREQCFRLRTEKAFPAVQVKTDLLPVNHVLNIMVANVLSLEE